MRDKTFSVGAFLGSLLQSISSIASLPFEMSLIDCAISKDITGAIHALVAVAGLIFLSFLFERISAWCDIRFSNHNKYKKIEEISITLHKIPLPEAESDHTQELLKQADEYYNKSADFRKAVNTFFELLLLVFLLVYILQNFLLSILFIAIFIAVLFFHSLAAKQTSNFWEKYMRNTRRYNYFSDVLTRREYAYERRTFNFSTRIGELFEKEFDEASIINRRSSLIRFRYQMITESILICCTIFTMFYFVRPLSLGDFTLGRYTIVIDIVYRVLSLLTISAQSVHFVDEYLRLHTKLKDFRAQPLNLPLKINKNDALISLRDVTFTYNIDQEPVIKNFSWSFEEGKRYGLVGVNGSGKSTLIKLMLGLYKPQHGNITANNNINDLCMVVFQDFCEYPLTIREFLMLGNSSQPSDKFIFDVLGKIGIENDVRSLKEQLDTPLTLLTEEGAQLSKGQIQKLAVARAFLTEKPIVILDEPTASLDPISERDLYDCSYKLLKYKTSLLISHRLGAVRMADEILVLDNGSLEEYGTHDELMDKGGLYYNLFDTQRSLYE